MGCINLLCNKKSPTKRWNPTHKSHPVCTAAEITPQRCPLLSEARAPKMCCGLYLFLSVGRSLTLWESYCPSLHRWYRPPRLQWHRLQWHSKERIAYSDTFSNSRLTFHMVKMFGNSDTVRCILLTVTLFQSPSTVTVSVEACTCIECNVTALQYLLGLFVPCYFIIKGPIMNIRRSKFRNQNVPTSQISSFPNCEAQKESQIFFLFKPKLRHGTWEYS